VHAGCRDRTRANAGVIAEVRLPEIVVKLGDHPIGNASGTGTVCQRGVQQAAILSKSGLSGP